MSTYLQVVRPFPSPFIALPSFLFLFSPKLLPFSLSLSILLSLFLSFFPSLSVRLDEIDESSSEFSISLCFRRLVGCPKKIHWYVLAKSHYRFSILVAVFVLFWGLVEFFFVDYDLGINFCYWVYVIIFLVCFDLGFQL